MQLTKKSIYALRVLKILVEKKDETPISAAVMAREANLSFKYLEQVLSLLKKNGVVASIKGKGGGYFLLKRTDEITIGDVIRAMDGPLAPIDCASRRYPAQCRDCPEPYESCWLRTLMTRVRDKIAEVLDRETIKDIDFFTPGE